MSLYLRLIFCLTLFYQGVLWAECDKYQYFDLRYPNDLKVGPKGGFSTPYAPFYNRGLFSGEKRPLDAAKNTGTFWVPKEACHKKEVDLLIALHGWRSFKDPTGNVFLKSKNHKYIEAIVKNHIDNGGAPLIVAGPMNDVGPRSNTWLPWDENKKTGYNINHHIEKMLVMLKQKNIGVSIKSVSILGHSNANCAQGLFRSAIELNKERFPLHMVLSADGTCGTSNFISAEFFKMVDQEKNAKLFHMWVWHKSDEITAKGIKKGRPGINHDPDVVEKNKNEYSQTWKSSDLKFYTYKLKVNGDLSRHTHSTVPMDILREVLPRFYK